MKRTLTAFVVVPLWAVGCLFGSTTVIYQPTLPTAGPFPSDALTSPAANQNTGRQVSLSAATCSTDPVYSCSNVALLNQLDGFSVNSQIVVCFSGPIDVNTLSGGISIVPVAQTGGSIRINQLSYDPAARCAYAKPDHVLQEQS